MDFVPLVKTPMYKLTECTNCNELSTLYNKLECTILYLAQNKWQTLAYNTSAYFDQKLFNKLVRYKRIVGERMHNCTYPAPDIKTADIINQAALIAFRDGNCSQCESCFPELETNSSSSTTSSTTSTTP